MADQEAQDPDPRRWLQRVVPVLPYQIHVLDVAGPRILWRNRDLRGQLGWPAESADAGDPFDLLHPDDRQRLPDLLARCARLPDGEWLETDLRLRHADGSWRWFRSRDTVLQRNADGRAELLVGTTIDVTDRVLLQQRVLQGHRLEALGSMAGGVAHDFNNLLTAILAGAEAAGQAVARGADPGADLQTIVTSARAGARIVRQLLTFARSQAVGDGTTDLARLLQDHRPVLARLSGKDVDLDLQVEAGPTDVAVDPDQILQVLVNLVVNARDAQPDGGRTTITVDRAEPPALAVPVTAGPAPAHRWVRLRVDDVGCGMEETVRNRCLEPFFSTKERGKGTGLGLATVYGIVQRARGRLAVESAPGRGTSIRIYLPLHA